MRYACSLLLAGTAVTITETKAKTALRTARKNFALSSSSRTDRPSFITESVKWRPSFITESDFHFGEKQDFSDWSDDYLLPGFDCSNWNNALTARSPVTNYEFSDCPTDKLVKVIEPKLVVKTDDYSIYDVGENLTGFVRIRITGDKPVTLTHSETMRDGDLEARRIYHQIDSFINAKRGAVVHQLLSHSGFRFFKIEGDGEPVDVYKIHADVKVTSTFESDNKILNWLYASYIRTQLANMHYGTPSDCPHIKRRGYTGDGQLTCHASMMMLDAKAFYKKWIRDIFDSQDSVTGHIQYTAPTTIAGGGPGRLGLRDSRRSL